LILTFEHFVSERKKEEKKRKRKKRKRERERESSNDSFYFFDDGVGRCEEKKRKKKKEKTERYLTYWGLFYFGAIFKLKLSCHLRIGCCKSWVLQLIRIQGFLLLLLLFLSKR
jgi:hypothetical protein